VFQHHSVSCLTTDWTTATGFRSPVEAKDVCSSLCVQTRSEAHPTSYPMATGGSFSSVNRGRGVKLTTHVHFVPINKISFFPCLLSALYSIKTIVLKRIIKMHILNLFSFWFHHEYPNCNK
jgi:hypothetical protein